MSKKLCVYVAGPMRGYKYFNYPAFDQAAAMLEAAGFEVINPADLDRRDTGFNPETMPDDWDWTVIPDGLGDLRDIFHRDTTAICKRADAIYLLPGWEKSKGVQAELALASVLKLLRIERL